MLTTESSVINVTLVKYDVKIIISIDMWSNEWNIIWTADGNNEFFMSFLRYWLSSESEPNFQ